MRAYFVDEMLATYTERQWNMLHDEVLAHVTHIIERRLETALDEELEDDIVESYLAKLLFLAEQLEHRQSLEVGNDLTGA